MLQLKKSNQSKIPMQLFLFYFYGATYVTIEIFFRGHSHWTMFLLGAICGLIIGALNEKISWEMPFELQCIIGAVVITLGEFIFGYILNIKLGLNIWDYSDMPMNIMGQICLPFTLAWCALSGVCIVLDDYLRYWFYDEEKPVYQSWVFKRNVG